MSIDLNELENVLANILKSQSSVNQSSASVGSSQNVENANFFMNEANVLFQSMGDLFKWLGQKMIGIENNTKGSANSSNTSSKSSLVSTDVASKTEKEDEIQSYTTIVVEAVNMNKPEKFIVKGDNNEELKKGVQSINYAISLENSSIDSFISRLEDIEKDFFSQPNTLSVSVTPQLYQKESTNKIFKSVLLPKIQHIEGLLDLKLLSESQSLSETQTQTIESLKEAKKSLSSLSNESAELLQELFSSVSDKMSNPQLTDITITDTGTISLFRKNIRKAVAVTASMIMDVNNIFISMGQHIIQDDKLGGAIFFKLDKDGTVLEELHSAIFKDSNEYDWFVTKAGGDRNNLWTKIEGGLEGKILTDNIPPEVAKLRDAVRRTQKNTAVAAAAAAIPPSTTAHSATLSAFPGGNNTTKKYYKRATRTKRPRRIGRRTR